MLTGNPITCTGNQVEVLTSCIAKNIYNGSLSRGIEGYLYHVEVQRFALCIEHLYLVTCLQVAQVPEHGWKAPRTIHVSIDDRTATLSRRGSQIVPSHILLL